MKQCVYFFAQKGTQFVKIGMTASSDITDRYRSFCMYSPMGSEIYGIIKTENARNLEVSIHKELAHKRLKGEFFNISKQDCESIIERYNSSQINSIVDKFYIWLSKNDGSEEMFNVMMKELSGNIKATSKESEFYEKLVLTYIDRDIRDRYMSTTEIKNYIEAITGEEILSIRSLGMALKKLVGKSKSVSINRNICQKYHVGLKSI